ncbi:hypothetical protein ACNS7O_12965 [Haloferacaceae archaeon DSL9]
MGTAGATDDVRRVCDPTEIRYLAAALALVSQGIHLWMLPDAIVSALIPGAFFFIVAVGQGVLGARLLFGPGRWSIRLGLALNLVVALAWVLTRVVALPNLTGAVDLPVEPLGIVATTAEIALVVALLWIRRDR